MTYAEAKAEALEYLDEHDAPSFALKALRRALDDPGHLGDSAEWRDALALLQRIFAKLEYEALAQLAAAAAQHVDDADALYRLAHATVLDAWGARPPRVLAFDNPDSRRLGLALATILGVRCRERVLVPDEPGLLVIYDPSQVIGEVLGRLREHRPGQMLFAHAMPAARELPVAADLTTLLAERVISPWARHTIVPRRPELPSAPPTESDEELAQRIVRAPIAPAALANLPQLKRDVLSRSWTSTGSPLIRRAFGSSSWSFQSISMLAAKPSWSRMCSMVWQRGRRECR